ncbi:MAG: hypothetical protein B1H13_08095 [Desulfobacteraceae bacterium 4484_190.3]|nr:MAG: hypothetical protein B1H13_08095 [Desulfobacteraceae bacterium 4484_190.3]
MVFSPYICACLCGCTCLRANTHRQAQTGYAKKIILANINCMPPVIFLHALISNENPHKSTDS